MSDPLPSLDTFTAETVRKRTPITDRFWTKVDVRGPDDCWLWNAAKDKRGYGQIATEAGKAPAKAYRLSYEIAKGPIPIGFVVMHTCDNPPCVNPSHLVAGTQRENIFDAIAKGRLTAARTRCGVPLDIYKARAIREEYSNSKTSHRKLADKYGVSHATIYRIITNRDWVELI